ncbi:MAG: hypothetical protein U0R68_07550 [Candidatus Nanopelagicales bacterium]
MLAETLPEPEHFVHAGDVLVRVAILVVAMLASVAAYHAMQRPRLVVSEVEPGLWRAKRRDVVQYVISIPWLLLLWMAGLELVLVFTNNGLSGPDVSAIAVAIVIAVRILAHVLHEHAHELAKTVPLTIVTLWVITANGLRSFDDATFTDWNRTALTGPTELLLVGTEFVVCALWYWVGVRWWWPKGHDLIGMPKHHHLEQAAILASVSAQASAAPTAEPAPVTDAEPPVEAVDSAPPEPVADPPDVDAAPPETAEAAADDEAVTLTEQEGEAPER